jgi:hypothetical protein
MRALGRGILVSLLMGGGLLGCVLSPAEQEATRRAWVERDAERARECQQKGGVFIAGGCVFGGGT